MIYGEGGGGAVTDIGAQILLLSDREKPPLSSLALSFHLLDF